MGVEEGGWGLMEEMRDCQNVSRRRWKVGVKNGFEARAWGTVKCADFFGVTVCALESMSGPYPFAPSSKTQYLFFFW